MEQVIGEFKSAFVHGDGHGVAESLSPVAPKHNAGRLYAFYRSSDSFSINGQLRSLLVYRSDAGLTKAEALGWLDVFSAYWKAVGEILTAEEAVNQGGPKIPNWTKVYEAWKDLINVLHRGYSSGALAPWTIPSIYNGGKYLRNFAIKADEQAAKTKGTVTFTSGFQDDIVSSADKNEKLEDAARQMNRLFSLCYSDRAPIEESRKWGSYYCANLLFKTYFKLNTISLSKNIIRSLQAAGPDMPPLGAFPKSHQVTFKYYAGVIAFLDEDYTQAEEYLTEAWRLSYKRKHSDQEANAAFYKNRELILIYLIPCHLLTTHTLPTAALLKPYPHLQRLFSPLASCIKRGDLAGFDAALAAGEDEFVKRRIYLTLERGRDIALRNLLRKVFLSGGYEPLKDGQTEKDMTRRTRITIAEFAAAIHLAMGKPREALDTEEVECLLANMIYKNLMKGYISRAHATVVLSKAGAFPGTGV